MVFQSLHPFLHGVHRVCEPVRPEDQHERSHGVYGEPDLATADLDL